MKATGFVRKLDELGRIVIPKELRVEFGMEPGKKVPILVEGGYIGIGFGILEENSSRNLPRRKTDELGRIVIPKEIREAFEIGDRSALELFVDDSMIWMRKHGNSCFFCGSQESVSVYKGYKICKNCSSKISDIFA